MGVTQGGWEQLLLFVGSGWAGIKVINNWQAGTLRSPGMCHQPHLKGGETEASGFLLGKWRSHTLPRP